jgi:D-beta-D-heptose 7-phosphate kinase/D-beta-D-heptose 1-phosphate adenosyltransferase
LIVEEISRGAGPDHVAAVWLANIAGGLEVEKIGVATVTRDEILRDLLRAGQVPGNGMEKVVSREELRHELESRRRLGMRIAFTNGCFDVLHAGHVLYLQEARAQADLLVVGLNSDTGVRALKGKNRPIHPELARAQVLSGLKAVDYVTIFEEPTPLALIQALRPDVLVKGADYKKNEVVGAELVESYGGRVYLAPLNEGFSTTGLLQRLGAA